MLNKSSRHGFTIVELVVIIVVISILAALTSMGFANIRERGQDQEYKSKVVAIMAGLERYYEENGEYPSNEYLNPDRDNETTDFTTISSLLPGTSPGDFVSSDGHSFFSYCAGATEGCVPLTTANWENVRSKQFIYFSDRPSAGPNRYKLGLGLTSAYKKGFGCNLITQPSAPGFSIAWYSNERSAWIFHKGKHGDITIEIQNNSDPDRQKCEFTTV